MTDRLDVFMESQREVNQNLMKTTTAMGEAIGDLEKHSVEVKGLVKLVNDTRDAVKQNTDDIAELKLEFGFVKDVKWVFRAIILALILGTGGMAWQVMKASDNVSKSDADAIIQAIKDSRPPAPQ